MISPDVSCFALRINARSARVGASRIASSRGTRSRDERNDFPNVSFRIANVSYRMHPSRLESRLELDGQLRWPFLLAYAAFAA